MEENLITPFKYQPCPKPPVVPLPISVDLSYCSGKSVDMGTTGKSRTLTCGLYCTTYTNDIIGWVPHNSRSDPYFLLHPSSQCNITGGALTCFHHSHIVGLHVHTQTTGLQRNLGRLTDLLVDLPVLLLARSRAVLAVLALATCE